jgi:hypothetical protein
VDPLELGQLKMQRWTTTTTVDSIRSRLGSENEFDGITSCGSVESSSESKCAATLFLVVVDIMILRFNLGSIMIHVNVVAVGDDITRLHGILFLLALEAPSRNKRWSSILPYIWQTRILTHLELGFRIFVDWS